MSKILFYHPALDVYHAVFRIMRLIHSLEIKELDVEAVRILDFYSCFPTLISYMRLTIDLKKWRPFFANKMNPYHFTGEPRMVFQRMEGVQMTALRALAIKDIIEKVKLENGSVTWTGKEYPIDILDLIKQRDNEEKELMMCINEIVTKIPLKGVNGLKDRSGLMEYRYDLT